MLAGAWCSTFGSSAVAQKGPEPPTITPFRYDEDYSYLRDSTARSGAWWEPFKFIPLDSAGRVYLTLGDEIRGRYERYWGNVWGDAPKPDEGYGRLRWLPYGDLHLGSHVRVFGQFINAWAARSAVSKNPATDETGVDILQAFADVRVPLGSGELTLRGGRQVMIYADQRLISTGPNIRLSFQGGLVRWEREDDWRVDAFYVRPIESGFGSFDNRPEAMRRIWSLYTTRMLCGIGPDTGIDIYYIGYENENARFNQGQGFEQRHTIGARFFGERGAWSWDWQTDFQTGKFQDGGILSGAVALATRYTGSSPREPYLEIRANALGGDADPTDRSLNTYNPMFPSAEFYGDIGLIGPSNLLSVRANYGMTLPSDFSLGGAATMYWRLSTGDGIYGAALNLQRPDGGSDARYTGAQGDLLLAWTANRNVAFRGVYSIFMPGRFIRDTGRDRAVRFILLQSRFTF